MQEQQTGEMIPNETSTDTISQKVLMYKLVTGDVVMGLESTTTASTESITLDRPVQLLLDPEKGAIGWIPYNTVYTQKEPENHTYEYKHIVEKIEVHASFEEAYLRQISGLELPDTTLEV